LDGERPFSFFDCGYAGYHGPRALMNLFLDLGSDSGDSRTTIGARFVPFALYVHERDTDDPDRLWALTKERLLEALVRIAESPSGDYYEAEKDRPHRFSAFAAAEQAVAVTKERGVVVLGNYKDPHLTELVSIKQALVSKGYDAKLIVELAESPMMSNEEKVRLYAQASRFCVMVDREPSGHVAEYGYLREQRVILAFLQPTGSGSTFMIGDASLVDVRHLATFKFKGSALSVLDQAVEWAEGLVRERENAYREAYPWRGT
jgi:hypothetical protein